MARKTPIQHDVVVAVFAKKLRQIRRTRGMTQRDLARAAHLTESYVSRLETGTIAPGIDLVARLARALGSPMTDLFPPDDSASTAAREIAEEQAKRLLPSVLKSQDASIVFLIAQVLAIVNESVERQR